MQKLGNYLRNDTGTDGELYGETDSTGATWLVRRVIHVNQDVPGMYPKDIVGIFCQQSYGCDTTTQPGDSYSFIFIYIYMYRTFLRSMSDWWSQSLVDQWLEIQKSPLSGGPVP